MTTLLFFHANGFPPLAYKKFLSCLKREDLQIRSINLHQKETNWHTLTQTLINITEENFPTPIIALGHSLGGALCLFASVLKPGLFKQIIAIDPPLLGPKDRWTIGLLRILGLERIVYSLPGKAQRRKHQFHSRDEARKYFKKKDFFKHFHPACFEDYLYYGLSPTPDGGFELTISPQIEAGVFKSLPCFFLPRLSRVNPIYTILYACPQGKPHNKGGVVWMKKALPSSALIPYDGGHMAPLENPQQMAKIVLRVLCPPV